MLKRFVLQIRKKQGLVWKRVNHGISSRLLAVTVIVPVVEILVMGDRVAVAVVLVVAVVSLSPTMSPFVLYYDRFFFFFFYKGFLFFFFSEK